MKKGPSPYPLPRGIAFLRRDGAGRSAIRHLRRGVLELRCRFFGSDATVIVQRRRRADWSETVYTGRDFAHLLRDFIGEDVRLIVSAGANGTAELVRRG